MSRYSEREVSAGSRAMTGISAAAGGDLLDLVSSRLDWLVRRHAGSPVKAVRDLRLVGFAGAAGALDFAIELHRGAGAGILLRTSIVCAAAAGRDPSDEDIAFACAVNALTGAGSICITGEVVAALGPVLKIGCGFRLQTTVPERREPVRVYRVSLDPVDAGRVIDARVGLWDEGGQE